MEFPGKSSRCEKSNYNYFIHQTTIRCLPFTGVQRRGYRASQAEWQLQTQTAPDLGIHLSVLRRWKKELESDGQQAFRGKGHTKEEEFRLLQKENQRLKDRVEILKKAVGVFSRRS